MTEHLPECWVTDPSNPPAWCICFSLRACEVRVLNAAREAVTAMVTERELRSPSGLDVDIHAVLAAIDSLKEKP